MATNKFLHALTQTSTRVEDSLKSILANVTVCPIHVAICYKILEAVSLLTSQLIYIPSGNSLGLLKYNGHIPWDDDVDVGFASNDTSFADFFNFIEQILQTGLFVCRVHTRLDTSYTDSNWTLNSKLETLNQDLTFAEFKKRTLEKTYFINVCFKENVRCKILSNFESTEYETIYWADSNNVVVPWIDIFPFQRSVNSLKSHLIPMPILSTRTLPRILFNKIPINVPANMMECLLNHYKNCDSQDIVYSHIKPRLYIVFDSALFEQLSFASYIYNTILFEIFKKIEPTCIS